VLPQSGNLSGKHRESRFGGRSALGKAGVGGSEGGFSSARRNLDGGSSQVAAPNTEHEGVTPSRPAERESAVAHFHQTRASLDFSGSMRSNSAPRSAFTRLTSYAPCKFSQNCSVVLKNRESRTALSAVIPRLSRTMSFSEAPAPANASPTHRLTGPSASKVLREVSRQGELSNLVYLFAPRP